MHTWRVVESRNRSPGIQSAKGQDHHWKTLYRPLGPRNSSDKLTCSVWLGERPENRLCVPRGVLHSTRSFKYDLQIRRFVWIFRHSISSPLQFDLTHPQGRQHGSSHSRRGQANPQGRLQLASLGMCLCGFFRQLYDWLRQVSNARDATRDTKQWLADITQCLHWNDIVSTQLRG